MKVTILLLIIILFTGCFIKKQETNKKEKFPHHLYHNEYSSITVEERKGGLYGNVYYWPFKKEPSFDIPRSEWEIINNPNLASLEEESKLKLYENLPVLDGATALLPVYAAFVESVYPKRDYGFDGYIKCSTTSIAYENLLNREVDIIFCTFPSEYHLNKAKELGVSFNLTPIGREAFVFFVNIKNPTENVTTDQIRGIYSGAINNWEEINGLNVEILPYQRAENSGSQTIFQSIMGDSKIREPISLYSMGEMIERVASYINTPNAIGYSFLFYATEMVGNQAIKLLAIDGIYPSKETIQNETYPYSVLFYAITLNNNKNENIDLFINWILSDQGQYLIEKTGYIPLN